MTEDQIIEAINEIMESSEKDTAKVQKALMLISDNDNDIYNRITAVLQKIDYAVLDIKSIKAAFKSKNSPDEKVAQFIYILTEGNPIKYNEISDILMS